MDKIPVYSLSKMMELVRKGYTVVKVVDNKNNAKMKVFMFKYDDGIIENLQTLDNQADCQMCPKMGHIL